MRYVFQHFVKCCLSCSSQKMRAELGLRRVVERFSPFQKYRPHALTPEMLSLFPSDRLGFHDLRNYDDGGVTMAFCHGLCRSGGMRNDHGGYGPVKGFTLDSVDMILHSRDTYIAYEQRAAKISKLRQTGISFFNHPATNFNSQQHAVLNVLKAQYQDLPPGAELGSARTFYAYHGPKFETLESVCMNGMISARAMDAGYFGAGCYTTLNIEYAIRYAAGEFDVKPGDAGQAPGPPRKLSPDGRIPIILYATCCGQAYPVTPALDYDNPGAGHSKYFGKPMKPGFDAHVICVSHHDRVGGEAVNAEQCQFVELVMDQETQLLAIAVLWFKRDIV